MGFPDCLAARDVDRLAQFAQLVARRSEGFAARCLVDGQMARHDIERKVPDALLLDLMLPGLDGIALCRAVRRFSDVPILMLTARVDEVDRLLGLDTGADE
jgi:two-component system, OmpR family, response regulator BaeR